MPGKTAILVSDDVIHFVTVYLMFSKSCESCCGPVKACACCASLSLPCFHIRADKALLNGKPK